MLVPTVRSVQGHESGIPPGIEENPLPRGVKTDAGKGTGNERNIEKIGTERNSDVENVKMVMMTTLVDGEMMAGGMKGWLPDVSASAIVTKQVKALGTAQEIDAGLW